jgi:hypothetical protein
MPRAHLEDQLLLRESISPKLQSLCRSTSLLACAIQGRCASLPAKEESRQDRLVGLRNRVHHPSSTQHASQGEGLLLVGLGHDNQCSAQSTTDEWSAQSGLPAHVPAPEATLLQIVKQKKAADIANRTVITTAHP